MLEESNPSWTAEIEKLKVIGRCGCGACPTIIFSESYSKPESKRIIADYTGITKDEDMVGLFVWAGEKEILELEIYPISDSDVCVLPKLDSLKPTEVNIIE